MSDTTKYEVAVQAADGTRYHIGYTARHSGRGLMGWLEEPTVREALVRLIGAPEARIVRSGGSAGARIGIFVGTEAQARAVVLFTGNTLRANDGSAPLPRLSAVLA